MTFGVRGLTVRFGPRAALEDVTLEVPPGRVTAVVGGDGAGKTTLLRVLAGALAPTAGEVRRPGPERIGHLPASSGTYPDLTVRENLAFVAAAYGVPAGAARERAEVLLSRTGLAGALDRLAGELSGGMRRKLGVVCAMLHRPELLVLDEPTTGIDPVSRADLWWLIARAAAEGAAVVLSTSYLDEAERAAWVLALDAGRTLAEGTAEDIVAAVPGAVCRAAERPSGDLAPLAWRRGAAWRVWLPDGVAPPAGPALEPLSPDLADAVTVAALARELALAGGDRR
jgi:ABC-2 type transport system ATP-binding protein